METDDDSSIVIHNRLLYSSFNSDSSCVCVGSKQGYFVFNTNPVMKRLVSKVEGMKVIELLNCSSLIVCVPSGDKAGSSPRKLYLINSFCDEKLCELSFPSTVQSCKLNNSNLLVGLEDQLYVYNITNMTLIKSFILPKNGCYALSRNGQSTLAYAVAGSPGQIGVYECGNSEIRLTCQVNAHKTAIACCELNCQGSILATCSLQGTLVRVFAIPTGELLRVFRRGMQAVHITSMSFCPRDAHLAVGSSTGSVHIFNMQPTVADPVLLRANSSVSAAAPSQSQSSLSSTRRSVESSTAVGAVAVAGLSLQAAASSVSSVLHSATSLLSDFVKSSDMMPQAARDVAENVRAWAIARIPGSEGEFRAVLVYQDQSCSGSDRHSDSGASSMSSGDSAGAKQRGKAPESPPVPLLLAVTDSGFLYRFVVPNDSEVRPSAVANEPRLCVLRDEDNLFEL